MFGREGICKSRFLRSRNLWWSRIPINRQFDALCTVYCFRLVAKLESLQGNENNLCRVRSSVSTYFVRQVFHTVFIRNIPILNLESKSEARRFITMIDTFYDNKTRIVASGMAPYWDLFQPEEMSQEVSSYIFVTHDDKSTSFVKLLKAAECIDSCNILD